MPEVKIKSKDEIILQIKEKITDIAGSDTGKPVNLDNVFFNESGKSNCGGKIIVTCLFINEDGNACADMYRSGPAGCVDFICGLALISVDEKILKRIISALDENRWSIADFQIEKQKKKNLVASLKIPFLQKGA